MSSNHRLFEYLSIHLWNLRGLVYTAVCTCAGNLLRVMPACRYSSEIRRLIKSCTVVAMNCCYSYVDNLGGLDQSEGCIHHLARNCKFITVYVHV